MYTDDKSLLKKLTIIVLTKVVIVYALWTIFVKEYRAPVNDVEQMSSHLFKSSISEPKQVAEEQVVNETIDNKVETK